MTRPQGRLVENWVDDDDVIAMEVSLLRALVWEGFAAVAMSIRALEIAERRLGCFTGVIGAIQEDGSRFLHVVVFTFLAMVI